MSNRFCEFLHLYKRRASRTDRAGECLEQQGSFRRPFRHERRGLPLKFLKSQATGDAQFPCRPPEKLLVGRGFKLLSFMVLTGEALRTEGLRPSWLAPIRYLIPGALNWLR